VDSRIIQLKQDVANIRADNDFLKRRNAKMQEAQTQLKKEVEYEKAEVDRQKSEVKRLWHRNNEVNQSNIDLSTENERLSTQARTVSNELKKKEREAQDLQNCVDLMQKNQESARANQQELSAKVEAMSSVKQHFDEMQGRLKGFQNRITELQIEVAEHKKIAADAVSKNTDSNLKQENNRLRQKVQEFEALKQKFMQTDMHDMYLKNQRYEEQIGFGKAKLSGLEREMSRLKASNQIAENRIVLMQMEIDTLHDEKEQVQQTASLMKDRYMEAVELVMEQGEHIDVELSHNDKLALNRRRSNLDFFNNKDPTKALSGGTQLPPHNYMAFYPSATPDHDFETDNESVFSEYDTDFSDATNFTDVTTYSMDFPLDRDALLASKTLL